MVSEYSKENKDNILSMYLNDISKYRLLDANEEAELSRKAKMGDDDAKDMLVVSNLRLVVNMAKKYCGKGVHILDLIQEGNKALMYGIEKFEPSKGFRVSTYLSWWIKQALTRALYYDRRIIRLPVHVEETINKYNRLKRTLQNELGREPSLEEISDHGEMPMEKVIQCEGFVTSSTTSLDQTISEDGTTLNHFLGKEHDYDDRWFMEAVAAATNELDEKERSVIEDRFGLNNRGAHTLQEIGDMFGVTRERIRQIESKALRQLRHPSRAKRLKDYYY